MIMSFQQLINKAIDYGPKKIAVAVAQDENVLEAVEEARERGIADAILVGDLHEIQVLAEKLAIDIDNYEIIDEIDPRAAVEKAVQLVATKKADILMKGFITTGEILKAVLNKEAGLRTNQILSHVCVMETEKYKKLLLVSDAGMIPYPDLKQKLQIIQNCFPVTKALEIDNPIFAVLSPVETVNPDMPSTVDAAILSKMSERGQIKGCVIEGPLALDNAISVEAAHHKHIESPYAGKADVLIVPNIETGNIMVKSQVYLANSKFGGIICGAKVPVVVVSRSDEPDAKLNSIAIAVLVA